ncbi:MAG: exodeoxyribonuclease VII small subunit [Lachnospiraceae bacterium]|jgi:exodeoxyribonuclease VII small subunit
MKIEEKLQRLNAITAELESGTLSLEDSLKKYEEGVRLVRECSAEIDRAEKTIQMINADSTRELNENMEASGETPGPQDDSAGAQPDSEDEDPYADPDRPWPSPEDEY